MKRGTLGQHIPRAKRAAYAVATGVASCPLARTAMFAAIAVLCAASSWAAQNCISNGDFELPYVGSGFSYNYSNAANGPTSAAFYSVTQSLENPNVFYAIVTEARAAAKKNKSVFQTNGRIPRRVSDLRTGREYPFTAPHGTVVENIDWSDIETFGATVLKFEF